ncbi:MAG: NAD(+)/NADH kinase [Alphaproteobacteria bacterium]|nr:NAD(+)/NADH kinase [Rickettsiales bacterium]
MAKFNKIGVFYINANPSVSWVSSIINEMSQIVNLVENPSATANISAIVPIGGDGTALRCIAKYAHLNIPFYGINQGTIGFFMNKNKPIQEAIKCIKDATKINIPAFECKILHNIDQTLNKPTSQQTDSLTSFFVNDVNIFRSTGQSADLSITTVMKNGENTHNNNVICDGVIAFSSIGSTGYNKSLGGNVVPLASKNISIRVIATQNQNIETCKEKWLTSVDSVVIENFKTKNRPCNCAIDGQTIFNVHKISIDSKKQKTVTLLLDDVNLRAKMYTKT